LLVCFHSYTRLNAIDVEPAYSALSGQDQGQRGSQKPPLRRAYGCGGGDDGPEPGGKHIRAVDARGPESAGARGHNEPQLKVGRTSQFPRRSTRAAPSLFARPTRKAPSLFQQTPARRDRYAESGHGRSCEGRHARPTWAYGIHTSDSNSTKSMS
jgi:hypothetical protein